MPNIRVISGEKIIIETDGNNITGKSILEYLRDNSISIAAPCGGNGTCGNCMVTVVYPGGNKKHEKACGTSIAEGMTIDISEVFTNDNAGIIEGSFSSGGDPSENKAFRTPGSGSAAQTAGNAPVPQRIGAACDLGTTTVAVQLFDLDTGELLSGSSAWNAQLSYGADVISRVKHTMDHPEGLDELSSIIRQQIAELISEAADGSISRPADGKISEGAVPAAPETLVVAGNTIMQHLFAGLDPAPITKMPFIPDTLFKEENYLHFEEFPNTRVSMLPCISGYVGGDISAGLLAVGLLPGQAQTDPPNYSSCTLFLDIGTNGEMALCFPDHIICCSAASGPAFEGASISCGMRSIPGAINHASFSGGQLELSVIGGTDQLGAGSAIPKPKGICGSGLVDLLSTLIDNEIVDETGRLSTPSEAPPEFRRFLTEDENENGVFWIDPARTVYLDQGDIRQIQLAKAAISAGIQCMTDEAGITYDSIDRVIIAGGFGKHLNKGSACNIGMIPYQLKDKITAAGNSSLEGAKLLLLGPERRKELTDLDERCKYLELSTDARFTDYFIDNMTFE